MTDDLVPYSLKLPNSLFKRLKIKYIADGHDYLYQLNDAAVDWSLHNHEKIMPLAQYKGGDSKYRPYYVSQKTALKIGELSERLHCSSTRALYTAIFCYSNTEEVEI